MVALTLIDVVVCDTGRALINGSAHQTAPCVSLGSELIKECIPQLAAELVRVTFRLWWQTRYVIKELLLCVSVALTYHTDNLNQTPLVNLQATVQWPRLLHCKDTYSCGVFIVQPWHCDLFCLTAYWVNISWHFLGLMRNKSTQNRGLPHSCHTCTGRGRKLGEGD